MRIFKLIMSTFAIMILVVPFVFGVVWFSLILAPVLFLLGIPFAGVFFIPYIRRSSKRSRPKVLIVDDDEIAVAPLVALLEIKGVEVDYVSSGVQMQEKMKNELSVSPYQLVILDSIMPVLSGEDALVKTDSSVSYEGVQVPVIFFTSNNHLVSPIGLKNFKILDCWNKWDPKLFEFQMDLVINKALGQYV